MNITTKDGRTFSGTALQIVRQMQSLAFGAADFTTEQYVAWVAENTQRFENVALTVAGSTPEELAESLLQELLRVGLGRAS